MKLKLAMTGFVFLGLALCSTAGTDTAKKLVGVWELTKQDGKKPQGKSVVEFTADGKYLLMETNKKGDKIEQKGTYTLKEDSLTIVLDNKVKIGDKEITVSIMGNIKKVTDAELHVEMAPLTGTSKSVLMEHKRVKK